MADFKPVNYDNVRWLNEEGFHYMNEFWSMDIETWNGAKKEAFTYCSGFTSAVQNNKFS